MHKMQTQGDYMAPLPNNKCHNNKNTFHYMDELCQANALDMKDLLCL